MHAFSTNIFPAEGFVDRILIEISRYFLKIAGVFTVELAKTRLKA